MGGPEGPHTLASEVVATQLASWFGLSTFEWAIIVVDEIDEIPFLDKEQKQTGLASPGPAFIVKAESGATWGGGDRELKMLVNSEGISRLVVFDTWVLNCDRYSLPKENLLGKPRINRDNVFLSDKAPAGQFLLKAMDHTHCFTCGREWTKKLAQVDIMKDSRVFGLFPEFRDFLRQDIVIKAAADLKNISREMVSEMLRQIPNEWEVTQQASDALVNLVIGRAAFVAETIEEQLCPQGELFPKDEEGDIEK